MKRGYLMMGAVVALSLVFTSAAAAASTRSGAIDRSTAIVELVGDPLSTSVRTRPTSGRKIDFNSTAVRSERAQLNQIRTDFKAWLNANAPKAKIAGSFDIAIHAVAVRLHGTSLSKIRSAPMVRSASLQTLYRMLAHDDPDLELVRAQEAWNAVGGASNAGQGV